MKNRIIIFSFTRAGTQLNRVLCKKLGSGKRQCTGYSSEKYAGKGILALGGEQRELIAREWGHAAFIFIGAAGIAVRWIAAEVKDKYTDSPVIVVDETGRYVIPLLSGHIGGAAALADETADILGAAAVHTAATDVRGKFAVDVFAQKNGMLIRNREAVKKISAAVLEGERIGLCIGYPEYRISGEIPQELMLLSGVPGETQCRYRIMITDGREKMQDDGGTIFLAPRNISAGIGCRRGTSGEVLEKGFLEVLERNKLDIRQIERFASINLKKNEKGIRELSKKYGIPFVTYSSDELAEIENVSSASAFVRQITGVDNVCESAALLSSGNGILIQKKCILPSMTCALAGRALEIVF